MSKIIVVEMSAAIDDIGTLQTFYECDGDSFTTRPTDVPANTYVGSRLLNPGNLRREMFSGTRTFGGVRAGFGEVVLFNGDGECDAWKSHGFDGQRFVARVGEQGAAYPAEFQVLFQCTMTAPEMTESEVRLSLRDRLGFLEKSVLNQTFSGAGGAEGATDMAGVAKPRVFGSPPFFPLKLVQSSALIYFVQCETPAAFASGVNLYEGGVLMTKGAPYSSIADMVSVSPAEGEYRVYGTGPVYVRLGSPPEFDLRVESYGVANSAGAEWTMGALAAEAGVTGTINAPANIFSQYVDDAGTSYLDVFTEAAKFDFAWFGFNRLDQFESGTFSAPVGPALYEFTESNGTKITRSAPSGSELPVYKVSANAGATWPCQCANGATALMRELLTRDPWFGKWSYANEAILLKHKLAESVVVDLIPRFDSSLAWETWRDRFMSLFGVERDEVTVETVLSDDEFDNLLALDLNDVVSVAIDRFGFDGGKIFRIIAISLNLKTKRVEFTLWG